MMGLVVGAESQGVGSEASRRARDKRTEMLMGAWGGEVVRWKGRGE